MSIHLSVVNHSQHDFFSHQQLRAWVRKIWQITDTLVGDLPHRLEIALLLVDEKEGQTLNHQYRHKDYATNILTFEYGYDETVPEDTMYSDWVLCIPVVHHEAKLQHKKLEHHTVHLLTHAVLHTLGFDHLTDTQAAEMESLEAQILEAFKIPNPYLLKE